MGRHNFDRECKPLQTNQACSGQAKSAIDGARRRVWPEPQVLERDRWRHSRRSQKNFVLAQTLEIPIDRSRSKGRRQEFTILTGFPFVSISEIWAFFYDSCSICSSSALNKLEIHQTNMKTMHACVWPEAQSVIASRRKRSNLAPFPIWHLTPLNCAKFWCFDGLKEFLLSFPASFP